MTVRGDLWDAGLACPPHYSALGPKGRRVHSQVFLKRVSGPLGGMLFLYLLVNEVDCRPSWVVRCELLLGLTRLYPL